MTYMLAERLGKTVEELLTGVPRPLSMSEYIMWCAYFKVKAYLEKKQAESRR